MESEFLYRKFQLVPETNWDQICKFSRNRHTMVLYGFDVKDQTKRIQKILLTHGSEDGSIHHEVDLATALYDQFDLIHCCHPRMVKEMFWRKYKKNLPINFDHWTGITWHRLSTENGKMFLELSNEKNMVKIQQTIDEFENW